MLKRLCWSFLLAVGLSAAADEAADKIAADAEKLETSVTAAEDAFRDGLQKSDMTGAREAVLNAMKEASGTSLRLGRTVRFRGHPGCDSALLFRWDHVNDLRDLLTRLICGELPDFALKLENTSADAATFAKNCICVDLQLPNRLYSPKKLPKRDFGEYQNNLTVLKDSGKRKAIVVTAQQWGNRVKAAEFFFWAVHKNAALVREDAEQLGSLPEFLRRQLDDVKKMVCCVLHFPRNTPPNTEFYRKLQLIRNASTVLTNHARKKNKPQLANRFDDAYKLEDLFSRWGARIPFYFYWAEVELSGLGEQAESLLSAQIPCDPPGLGGKADEDKKTAKEKTDKEKDDKKSKGRKGKKKKDAAQLGMYGLDRIAGEDDGPGDGPGGGDNPDGGAPAPGGAKKKGKEVPFEDAVKEYNLQIFEENGASRRDARIAARFKQDMAEFAKILSEIAKGTEEFQSTFPDAMTGARPKK